MQEQLKTYEQFCDFWGFDKKTDEYKDLHHCYLIEAEKQYYASSTEDDWI